MHISLCLDPSSLIYVVDVIAFISVRCGSAPRGWRSNWDTVHEIMIATSHSWTSQHHNFTTSSYFILHHTILLQINGVLKHLGLSPWESWPWTSDIVMSYVLILIHVFVDYDIPSRVLFSLTESVEVWTWRSSFMFIRAQASLILVLAWSGPGRLGIGNIWHSRQSSTGECMQSSPAAPAFLAVHRWWIASDYDIIWKNSATSTKRRRRAIARKRNGAREIKSNRPLHPQQAPVKRTLLRNPIARQQATYCRRREDQREPDISWYRKLAISAT